MKFLLELVVPCFGSQQLHQSADGSVSDETKTLMKHRRRRQRVRVAGQPGHVADWRPSLSVISENKPEEDRRIGRKSEVSGKNVSSRSASGDQVRHRCNDFRRNAFEPVIPAFSPTPFMF